MKPIAKVITMEKEQEQVRRPRDSSLTHVSRPPFMFLGKTLSVKNFT